jgi:predicted nuclease with TOPRIM domain
LNSQIKQNKGHIDKIINEKNNRINTLIQECETLKTNINSKNDNINQLNIESQQLKEEFDQLKEETKRLNDIESNKNIHITKTLQHLDNQNVNYTYKNGTILFKN